MPAKKRRTSRSVARKHKHEITSIDPISGAKIFGLIGLIFGAIAALILVFLGNQVALTVFGTAAIGSLHSMVILSLPFVYAVKFAVSAFILAWLYNLIAGKVGGLRLRL